MSAPSDLTTTAAVKQWLGLASTGDDALISALVTSVSRAILADLGRGTILPQTRTEIFDGGGADLALGAWPVTTVLSVTANGGALAPAGGNCGWDFDPPAAAPPGCMQRLRFRGGAFPHGVGTIAVTFRAGYEITGEAAVVPASAPFTVTAAAPFGAWALDTGVNGGSYTVAAGVYTFDPSCAGQSVTLAYGYIPADLAQAAVEWVADRYAARSRIGQSAKTLGGQETTSFVVKAMPDVVDRLLRPYRRVAR